MRTYAKSCVRRKSFYSKSELQMLMLSLISGGHICVSKLYTNMASPSKVYNGAWNVSANNSETVGHIDLRLGKIVYISVCCNTSFSWLFPLDGFQFIFLCRIYCVTVKWDRLKGLCNLIPWGRGWGVCSGVRQTQTADWQVNPGGRGTPICGLYRYLPRNRVWVLRFLARGGGGGTRNFKWRDDRRIFWGLKFLIPGFFGVRKFGKYFFG